MRKLKFLIMLLIVSGPQITNAILFSILKDLAIGVDALNRINEENRKALLECAKNIVGGPNRPIFRRNNASSKEATDSRFGFKDLAGKIPESVVEIVDFISSPEKFDKVGAKRPRGILMVGPPGTGKTSIARALAGEGNAAFISASASEFIEIYVGVGPKRIRELFDSAREAIAYGPHKSAIIFIDELDAIGSQRTVEGNSEYKNTLNELLNQMDGFKRDDSIMVIGATNVVDAIDPALKRPGRFDRIVEIGLPDQESRLDIIEFYCKKISYDKSINLTKFALETNDWSPAELENFVNEAAVRAARDNSDIVYEKHFEIALKEEKVRRRMSGSILRSAGGPRVW